jgi:hypothetical protein
VATSGAILFCVGLVATQETLKISLKIKCGVRLCSSYQWTREFFAVLAGFHTLRLRFLALPIRMHIHFN